VLSIHSRVLAAAGISIALVLAGCNSSKPVQAEAPAAKNDKPLKAAAEFELKDADGKTVRLSDYKGKVVLLDFWATWCEPCKIEIPWFIEFERTYKDKGFAVIGIAMDDEGWTVIKPFVSDLAINYRILKGDDKTADLYGPIDAYPTTFLITRDGKIADQHVGLTGRDDFENGIKKLLGAPGIVQERASIGLTSRFAPAVLFGAK
jgi:thiol-disulfide isomerase/thioredoxin